MLAIDLFKRPIFSLSVSSSLFAFMGAGSGVRCSAILFRRRFGILPGLGWHFAHAMAACRRHLVPHRGILGGSLPFAHIRSHRHRCDERWTGVARHASTASHGFPNRVACFFRRLGLRIFWRTQQSRHGRSRPRERSGGAGGISTMSAAARSIDWNIGGGGDFQSCRPWRSQPARHQVALLFGRQPLRLPGASLHRAPTPPPPRIATRIKELESSRFAG